MLAIMILLPILYIPLNEVLRDWTDWILILYLIITATFMVLLTYTTYKEPESWVLGILAVLVTLMLGAGLPILFCIQNIIIDCSWIILGTTPTIGGIFVICLIAFVVFFIKYRK